MEQIHFYAEQGNILGVTEQLAAGVDVDCIEAWYSQTPLMWAIKSIHAKLDMLRFLINHGATVNANVLRVAVQSGDLDKIRFLLDVVSNLPLRNQNCPDLLRSAIPEIDTDKPENLSSENLSLIVKLLIERGAEINHITGNGYSALNCASEIGRFDVVKILLEAGADLTQLEWTELMSAIAFGSLEEVKARLNEGADLSVRDFNDRTPWLLSLQVGELEKAKLLLSSGANRDEVGRWGRTPLMYAIDSRNLDILQWLIEEGFELEATDFYGENTPLIMAAERGETDCVRILLENGANPAREDEYGDTVIKWATNPDIVRMLVNAGADINDINKHARALLTGVGDHALEVSTEEYFSEQGRQERNRRFGRTNPEVMDVNFWKAMVRCRDNAGYVQLTFNDYNDLQPIWCYDRFGRTITQLPDGRIIEIAGEHEDWYDANFCIYNDVVVFQGDGTFKIFGYPKDVFPPTDFHSGTLVGNYIYIIGSLGYQNERIYHETPVYRLNCDTFKIEKVETTGDKPGWISHHKAYLKEKSRINITGGKVGIMIEGKEEYIENLVDYTLDLINLSWSSSDA